MVAPFNVHGVMMHEDIHDAVGMRAAVKDIAHDVQAVDSEVFDEDCERDEQAVHAARGDQGFNDRVVIAPAVAFLLGFLSGFIVLVVHEFVEQERPVFGHGTADFVARILGGQHSGQVHHMLDLLLVPGGGNLSLLVVLLEDGVWIIDERAQFIGLANRQVREPQVHFFPDDAGAVVHDMAERFVFPVNIAHEMLSALGQAELSTDTGDFRAQCFNGGVLFPQKTQVFQ